MNFLALRARMLIGTSGWSYSSWKKIFYPEDLPSRGYLAFYSHEFQTTEVNYSFYHLPRPSTCEKWADQVPDEFVFALKVSRFITHVKRLIDVEEPWRRFVGIIKLLGPHLGPLLFQFPPSFHCDLARLASILETAKEAKTGEQQLRLAFEFRHPSWFKDEIYRLLESHQAALCIADSPCYPREDTVTARFAYLRFHGRSQLFASKYTDSELAAEAKKIKGYIHQGLDVYAYFNNDAFGHAFDNAKTLITLVDGRKKQ